MSVVTDNNIVFPYFACGEGINVIGEDSIARCSAQHDVVAFVSIDRVIVTDGWCECEDVHKR